MVVSIVILNEAKHKTFYVRGFHSETNMGPCVFALGYFYEMPFFIFNLLSLTPFAAPAIPVLEGAAETIWRAVNAVSTRRSTFHFFRLSCNIQTLCYWGRKGELYTSYHIRLIS